MNNKKFGDIGEDAAAEMLELKGYEILFRNFRCRMGEVDIIARKNDEIIFVEVKSRQSMKFGRPCEAVNADKRKKLLQLAEYYCMYSQRKYERVKIDVVEVYINHIENAVQS